MINILGYKFNHLMFIFRDIKGKKYKLLFLVQAFCNAC